MAYIKIIINFFIFGEEACNDMFAEMARRQNIEISSKYFNFIEYAFLDT